MTLHKLFYNAINYFSVQLVKNVTTFMVIVDIEKVNLQLQLRAVFNSAYRIDIPIRHSKMFLSVRFTYKVYVLNLSYLNLPDYLLRKGRIYFL